MDKVFQLLRSLGRVSAESFLVKRVEGGASNRIVSNSVFSTDRGFCVAATNLPDIENRPYLDPGLPEERSVLRGVKPHENNEEKQENLPAEAENIRRKTEKLNLPPGDHILRIPRWGTQSCKHEIAMLRFVRSLISICVPIVVHFDISNGDQNPLRSPYVLQFSVPEKRLNDIWPALNNTQRLLIGLDIARLCTQLIKITNKSGGVPDVEQGPGVYGTLRKTNFHFPGDEEASEKFLSLQPPVDMLCERLIRWAEKYPNYDGSSPYYGAIEVVSGKNAAFVTGIVDWDDAHFAPAVISFSPPAWLWMTGFWKDYSEEGFLEEGDLWRAAETEPEDEGSKEIKPLFNIIVGSQFLQYAYSPDAYTARKIWRSAYETVGKSWVESEVESMYRDWKIGQGKASNVE
ncbi:hypothetical protein V8E51_013056 [Hyaloscypha variabilis]